jgi:uncharacterized protein
VLSFFAAYNPVMNPKTTKPAASLWRELCRKGEVRTLILSGSEIERLQSYCFEPLASAEARFEGSETKRADGSVEHRIRLSVSAHAVLTCQRCLSGLPTHIAGERSFVLLKDEAAVDAYDELNDDDDEAPEGFAADSAVSFAQLAEEELVLLMPIVPRHTVCPTALAPALMDSLGRAVEQPGFEDVEAASPFAGLQGLASKTGAKPTKN